MFGQNIVSTKIYSTKTDRIAAYKTFLDEIRQDAKEYPYSLEMKETYKGKPIVFVIASFGGYYNADNVWTVFISYRCNLPKHTIQHSWSWDVESSTCSNYRIMEFIN